MSERIIDGFMNSGEAANQLGMHKQSILRLAKNGKIRHRKVGKSFYFTKQDLNNYLDSTIVEPKTCMETESVFLTHIESEQ